MGHAVKPVQRKTGQHIVGMLALPRKPAGRLHFGIGADERHGGNSQIGRHQAEVGHHIVAVMGQVALGHPRQLVCVGQRVHLGPFQGVGFAIGHGPHVGHHLATQQQKQQEQRQCRAKSDGSGHVSWLPGGSEVRRWWTLADGSR